MYKAVPDWRPSLFSATNQESVSPLWNYTSRKTSALSILTFKSAPTLRVITSSTLATDSVIDLVLCNLVAHLYAWFIAFIISGRTYLHLSVALYLSMILSLSLSLSVYNSVCVCVCVCLCTHLSILASISTRVLWTYICLSIYLQLSFRTSLLRSNCSLKPPIERKLKSKTNTVYSYLNNGG